ncbi:MAG: exodeoxyribonuclease V subunit alpha, partial [Oxalobacter sp.]|nr:exodeoxyribonuclease V subunit alpha [Oxalobacter sp.]
MMDTASMETPEQTLAKAFARHVLEWAREMTAENGGTLDRAARTLLERAAYHTSLAVSSGNTCLSLTELAAAGTDDRDTLRASLLASGMVARSDAPGNAPLVLDGGDRLYLHRY